MRIAIDLTSLAGNYSGIEQFAYHITKALIRLEDANSFVLLFQDEIFPLLNEEATLPWVEVRIIHPRHGHRLFVTQASIPNALRGIDADVYLFPAFPQPLTFFDKRAVTVLHDVSFYDCPQTLTRTSRLYWRVSSRHVVRQPLTITVSQFSRNRISERLSCDPSRIAVVYNGVEPRFASARIEQGEAFYQAIREKYSLPARFVLSLCTLEPRKNLTQLLQAWTIAKQSAPDTPDLVLAGRKGWKTDKLLEDVPTDLLEHIHLTGFIDNDDLPHIYHMSDRFVFPSLYEGFGLPPLEALAAGAKVLCSDIEVFHETCEDAVSFFPVGDPQRLAQLLTSTPPDSPEVFDVCVRYSWENSARTLLQALKGL